MNPNLNPRLKLWQGLRSPVIDVSVKRDSLLVYRLKFFGLLAGRCGSVVVRKRDWDTKGACSVSRLDPGSRFSFFLIGTLSITERFRTGQAANCTDRDGFIL